MVPDFNFNKGKARQALALGDLERAVLEALWEHGETSGKEIFNLLGKKHKVRHNTLLTVLDRLIKKGLVLKQRDGRNNTYSAKISREEFAKEIASPIIEELLDVSSHAAMSAFVESAGRDPEKLEELKKLIREAEKKNS
ncbi:BlaI/MecI/CopY family transcriptional regulator [bacterium]|nr:BlaI/MecI/CopY family transcriptional regulator [bacterium]